MRGMRSSWQCPWQCWHSLSISNDKHSSADISQQFSDVKILEIHFLTLRSVTKTDPGRSCVANVLELSGRDDVVVDGDVRLSVDLLHHGGSQPEGGMAVPGFQPAPEDVREVRPELLSATESSEVPAVSVGVEEAQLGVVTGHHQPLSPGLDQFGSLLLGRLLVHRSGEEVPTPIPAHHSLVVLTGGVVEELLDLVLADALVPLLPGQHPGLLEPLDAAGEDAAVEAVFSDEEAVLGGELGAGPDPSDLAPGNLRDVELVHVLQPDDGLGSPVQVQLLRHHASEPEPLDIGRNVWNGGLLLQYPGVFSLMTPRYWDVITPNC